MKLRIFSLLVATSIVSTKAQAGGSSWKCSNQDSSTRLEWNSAPGKLFYHRPGGTVIVVAIDNKTFGQDDVFDGPQLKMTEQSTVESNEYYILQGLIEGQSYQVTVKPEHASHPATADILNITTGMTESLNCSNVGF